MAHRSDAEMIRTTHNTARFFTEHRQVSWIVLLAVLLWGVYGYATMPKRKDPVMPVRVATAVCPWPGVSAEKVEQLVTRAMEEKIAESTALHKPGGGDSFGVRSLTLTGTFSLTSALNAGAATVKLEALLAEGDPPRELVSGLPLQLVARRGGSPTSAVYEDAEGTRLKVRLKLKNRDPGQHLWQATLKVENATIAFPELCTAGGPPTTTLFTAVTIDDESNPPVTVAVETAWECTGKDPAQPKKLKVK